ncbi:sulfatase [Aquimarina sp. U1-2]|uniref:sulfatase family protein n=1 Tax=Aquimarina sp. U1-2 TaxID=2823141 RepID=UPI001AECE91C|nr:sulfatase [Aquimarina sp. U1-2]MBP2831461.1 sulfatase [Aquimarina sp. U1-2]
MNSPISFIIICLSFMFLQACKKDKNDHQENTVQPNILWIVSEDNSPWLGAYGDTLAITPNLDRLASNGILFTNAYSNAPVCAPSRNTLITGIYSPTLGTQHMRSTYAIPDSIQFYPKLLKDAGYYTTNNFKRDYNTPDRLEEWSDYSKTSSYKNRPEGVPFFSIINLHDTHESKLHRDSIPKTPTDHIRLYPYHPDTPEMRSDYAVYYDRLQDLDTKVGNILNELEKENLLESTIIFYYSDHGGAVAGTKRYATQQGLNVPLIVRVPEKFKHLTTYQPGEKVNQPVAFIDFPPTLMQLAGISIPDQFQGTPFLSRKNEKKLAFGFAGRMDEHMNMVRTVTDGTYRYTRNYTPNIPYGGYLQTLWKSKGMQSWHQAYLDNATNDTQSQFFKARDFEELYDIKEDPFQLKNLAKDTTLSTIKTKLSKALTDWQIKNRDAGFIPEAMLQQIDTEGLIFTYTHSKEYPLERVLNLVEENYNSDTILPDELFKNFESNNPVINFWIAQILSTKNNLDFKSLVTLKKRLYDVKPYTGIVMAKALYENNENKYAYDYLYTILDHKELIIRVQALNVLSQMQEIPSIFMPKLTKLASKTKDRKDPYDKRLALYILKKNTNKISDNN